jgi:hypothetical protein
MTDALPGLGADEIFNLNLASERRLMALVKVGHAGHITLPAESATA